MQLIQQNSKIIEKILRNKDGRLVRATFCVYEYNGRIKARLVKAVLIDEAPTIENKTFALPGFVSQASQEFVTFVQKATVSPYFASNLLYSLGLQPRAPSFK